MTVNRFVYKKAESWQKDELQLLMGRHCCYQERSLGPRTPCTGTAECPAARMASGSEEVGISNYVLQGTRAGARRNGKGQHFQAKSDTVDILFCRGK